LLRAVRPDCVVSANILPSAILRVVHGKVPLVIDYLDHFEESAGAYYDEGLKREAVRTISRAIVRWSLAGASHIITVTRELANLLAGMTDVPISVVPNGADLATLRPTNGGAIRERYSLESPVLGYVGSLESWVDLETVVRAFPKVLSSLPKASLLVVGPSLFTSYRQDLETLASDLGVRSRIHFAGPVAYEDLPLYIGAMDICLNPLKPMTKNLYAAGGKVFAYLACGKPVLSSMSPSLESLFGTSSGIRFYENEETLVLQVQEMLQVAWDPLFLRSLVTDYDWSRIAQRYVSVLQSVSMGRPFAEAAK